MIFDTVSYALAGGVGCLMAGGAEGLASASRRHVDIETQNFNRATAGFGGLAVSAFMVQSAAADFGGYARLGHFMAGLPYRPQPWPVIVTLAAWALLLSSSALRFCVGIKATAGRRSALKFGASLFWLLVCSGLWWRGVFFPRVAALEPVPSSVNFALTALYLYGVSSSGAGLLLALRRAAVQRLPSPEELGMPMAGPASRSEAHGALSGGYAGKPPKFKD